MRLASLSLWLYSEAGLPSSTTAFLSALFTSSSASLETLHLRLSDSTSESPLYSTFGLVASALRTLVLESAHDAFDGHINLFASCTMLETLELRFDSWTERGPAAHPSPPHLRAILDALPSPPILRHLFLDLATPDHAEPILPLLDHPALSVLVKLAFPRISASLASLARRRLAIVCDAPGIELSFD